MPNIKSYSTTPASNTTLFPEGMARNQVNDSARQIQADLRGTVEELPWFEFSSAITWISGTQFRVAGDLTGIIQTDYRLKASGSLTGTIYGSVTTATYSSPNTTITVVWDSGALSNETLTISVSRVNDANADLPAASKTQSYIPPGSLMPYAGSSAPSDWFLCYGQAISRTTYAALFAAISTTYGAGDGSTTFNLPDLRGRVIAGQDDMGGTSADRMTAAGSGLNGDTLGAAGGAETHSLTADQNGLHGHQMFSSSDGSADGGSTGGITTSSTNNALRALFTGTANFASGQQIGGSGNGDAHNNVQPTIILNYIIKV